VKVKIVKRKRSIEFLLKEIDTRKEKELERKFTDILTSMLQSKKLDYILDRKVSK
jgi:hypothetical protein